MKKQLLILPSIAFALILCVFFFLLIIERDPSEIPSNLINKKIPNFETVSLISGKQFIIKNELKNEVVLINFFATWCKPCRDEHVYIKRFDTNGIKIIGINYKDNKEKALDWLKNLGNPYHKIAIDRKGRIAIDWGVYGIPETFVIDSKGIIRYRHAGPITEKIYKKINLIISKAKQNDK